MTLRTPSCAREVIGDGLGVADMALDAQRQRLDALQDQEGVERREGGADVAQKRRARLDDIGDRPERLHRFRPDRAMIAGVRRIERRLALLMRFPVEIAAVDDERRRSNCRGRRDIWWPNRRRSPRHAPAGGDRIGDGRIVDDQRNAERAADGGDLGDRQDGELRVRQRLGVIGAGARIGGAAESLRVGRIDEAHFDALILQRIGEEVPGAAVKIGGADDIVAGAGEILHREGRGRLARGQRQSARRRLPAPPRASPARPWSDCRSAYRCCQVPSRRKGRRRAAVSGNW